MSDVLRSAPEDDARVSAQAVKDTLDNLVNEFAALGADHPQHIHILFCELYLCSVTHWLRALGTLKGCEYHYRFIVAFYDFYHREVVENQDCPLQDTAANWRLYHRLARRLTIRSPISTHLLVISTGVRAHVHLDFGAAMHAVERQMGLQSDQVNSAQARLLGAVSDKDFLAAALDFVDRHRTGQKGWRWMVLSLFRFGLYGLKPIWLLTLKRWRRQGYEMTKNTPSAAT